MPSLVTTPATSGWELQPQLCGGSPHLRRWYFPKALELNNGNQGVEALVFDQDGSLLVGIDRSSSDRGLHRLRCDQGSTVTAPGFDGSKLAVYSLFKRCSWCTLWIETDKGLDSFRDLPVLAVSRTELGFQKSIPASTFAISFTGSFLYQLRFGP